MAQTTVRTEASGRAESTGRTGTTSRTDTTARDRAEVPHESLGDLVALAVSDISQLVRYEVDLAKLELKADARRLGIGAALLGVAAFVGCLVLMLLCFGYAYGLHAAGLWLWASFLIAAGTCIGLAILAVVIGITRFRGLTGLSKTRTTVSDDLAAIKHPNGDAPASAAGTR
jgi:Putative Actinobacterial Holin-X, holin superfamily III